MQISVQQQLKGLPKFRLHTGFSAYAEGWALYAEQLGKEVGFYQDPVSDYGRLNSELFRAVRLVVDTGIHANGWTRDQVVDYMRKNDVNEPLRIADMLLVVPVADDRLESIVSGDPVRDISLVSL
jgi:uncharacterized protein (DUF885 family)